MIDRNKWMIIKILLALVIIVGAMFVFNMDIKCKAESGTYRDVDWDLTDGVLTIGRAGQTQTFSNTLNQLVDGWPWYSNRSSITSARFVGNVVGQGSMNGMFYECSSLTSLDLSAFDISNVTNMSSMFSGCSKLTSLDISKFNTSNVTSMYGMFSGCSKLTSLDISKFNTSNVTSMYGMFRGCSSLISLDVSGFNTSNVANMYQMFYRCSSLTLLDVSGFNTLNVTNMSYMFSYCSGLTSLDLSNFNTSNTTDMYGMFSGCSSLTSLDVSGFDTSGVKYVGSMFKDCSSLTSLDVSGFNTSGVTRMREMFRGCSELTSLDLSNFNTSNTTDMYGMFNGCSKLEEVKLGSNFSFDGKGSISNKAVLPTGKWKNTRTGTTYTEAELRDSYVGSTMYGTYVKVTPPCARLYSNGDLVFYDNSNTIESSRGTVVSTYTGWDTVTYSSYSSVPWYSVRSGIKQVIVKDIVSPISTRYWFYNCDKLTSADLEKLDTSNVTNMNSMFYGCSKLTLLDLSNFDTSRVTDMYGMFYKCSSLTLLDVSGFNTSNVTKMGSMFDSCRGLTSLDVSHFNTSKVTNMDSMFSGCFGLTSLDVSGFDTSNVTNMYSMFYYCSSLTSLDVSGFDTSNVTNMSWMFGVCSKLEEVKLGSEFSFKGNGITATSTMAVLPTPTGDRYTGKWVKENGVGNSYTPVELRDSYNGPTMSGTWVWEEAIMTLVFEKPVVDRDKYVGSMPSQTSNPLVDITLPIDRFSRLGYVFDHWIDGNGNEYENKGVIPANRYSTGDTVILTAVFMPFSGSVVSEDGQFEFDLQGGTTAKFDGIPGNTQYQIWEEIPDGWQLVQEGNTSGIIPSERTATVAYRNNYNPDLAQVMLVGQKKVIDSSGIALYPVENQYTFTLTETTGGSSVPLQEIKNSDGGIIRFDPIELNSVSTHTYEIREVAGGNSHMDYDSHVETVTVRVTDNGSGLLTSEITTDSDGIVFTNYLNDRGSLKLTKIANDETGSTHWNDGETFSFNITFRDKYDSVPSDAYGTYLSNEASENGWTYNSTTGVMTVILNESNQNAVIENIPYGLRYSIRENLSESSLYELTNVTGNTGVISETQSEAVFTNTFKTVPTSVMLMAYKTADFDLENGQFEFELLNADKSKVLQRVSNGDIVEDGNEAGKAPIVFDSIPITEAKDYVYYIREKVESNDEYIYDDQLIKVTVHAENDHGYLKANVTYEY